MTTTFVVLFLLCVSGVAQVKQGATPATVFLNPVPQAAPTEGRLSDKHLLVEAEAGDAVAQFDLAVLYDQGYGVPQDYAQAIVWYRKSAIQGNANAQTNLCEMYGDGHGVSKDYAKAIYWCRKAAKQGSAAAQYSLGASYYQGFGVPQDYEEAYFWLDLAASGKFESSNVNRKDVVRYRDQVASHLSSSELNRVQERARKWFESHPQPIN